MSDDFVHLHVHSEYSLLDGMGRTGQLAKRAAELGQPALALTDHGVMHGAVEFARVAAGAGVKPLIGVEAYLTADGRPMGGRDPERDKRRYHLLLLAENQTGYRNLIEICTAAQLDGYYYRPRIDREFLEKHAEGLICTSGCLASELPSLLKNGQESQALERLQWYRDVFGPERWYVEFQEHDIPELTQVNKQLWSFARRYDLPVVVTNDVHYVRSEDANPHDVLLCVQTSSLVNQTERMRMPGGSFFLKSLEQMRQTFLPLTDLPESAFTNTLKIAEMCHVDLEDKEYHLPDITIPPGYTYQSYLRHITMEGLQRRYGERADDPVVQQRAEHELRIIHDMGFDVYYLIVWDLIVYARSRNIWWNVRGSGAGSIVAYAIGVTNLDPLRNKLIFERFLNPGRVTMPDFDLDFPDDQREEMIRYTVEKYGADRVAQVVTFGRMKARAALRDVGRAMDVPLSDVDRLAKMIPAIPGKPVSIRDVLTEGQEFYSAELKQQYEAEAYVRELLDTASKLEGVARHSSIHAAAVIVTDKPLTNYVPLMRPPKSAVTEKITQYEFPILDSIGLLKVDFLGLATLTLMREAARLIKERHGVEYTLDSVPIDEACIYDLLSSGDVMGVFQVEGAGMRRVLMELRPKEFEHIVATISLYRPGPMEFIPDYIKVLHKEQKPHYPHKILAPILEETMGVCVSGDAMVTDAGTGRRYRLDALKDHAPGMLVQGIDEHGCVATGRVSRWIDSGHKPVSDVTLRNGASIKITSDHRLLTERGWRPLSDLKPGDYIGTPPHLVAEGIGSPCDRRRLRVLAYLIADGSLTSGTMADFVSKDAGMLAEYVRCLEAFDNVSASYVEQIRSVTRIGAAKSAHGGARYGTPNSLLQWLRGLGLKYPPGSKPGGAGSREKFVPEFVFELSADEIAFFLASLWDGDGYMGTKLCHYRTVSRRLAEDVQHLLLRLGIQATIHASQYETGRGNVAPVNSPSYQVTVYDTARLAALLQPHMISRKRIVECRGVAAPTVARSPFMAELAHAWQGSQKGLMGLHGFDRQHFRTAHREPERIPARVVERVAHELEMPVTAHNLNTVWQQIVSIEPAGVEHVYDLTVEGLHSFVANGIIVHNCVYQEQVIQILTDIAGYSAGEADLVRRGISKKARKVLDEHREVFAEGSARVSKLTREEADGIWDALMGFARYGFNRAHAADYAVIVAQTAFMKATYPAEYMAALLTIERHDTEKVGVLIAECRRMGLEVLPPDINVSSNGFTIEQLPPSRAALRQLTTYRFPLPEGMAIRMGLDAIKNVGEGAIELILKARGDRAFASLEEFADRVDLRQVNRRVLECLVKVGALDCWGPREKLLAAIDRIIGRSANAHEAAEIGQMSLFGGPDDTGQDSGGLLEHMNGIKPLNAKETLAWEKELVGVYVSAHPLQRMTVDLANVVTHQCIDITEEIAKTPVVIAGMITDVRTITTKKGDTMAFVRLEDLQGATEITVFPSILKETRALWVAEKIVIVRGKVDARNGRAGIIAEGVQDYVEGRAVIDDTTSVHYRYHNGQLPSRPQARYRVDPEEGPYDLEEENGSAPYDANPFAGEQPAWEDGESVPRAQAPIPPPAPRSLSNGHAAGYSTLRAGAAKPAATPPVSASGEPERPGKAAPAAAPAGEPGEPRALRIPFSRSPSIEDDRRRLGQLLSILGRYPGEDGFQVVVEASDGIRYELDFPNIRIDVCPQLEAEIGEWRGNR